MATLTDTDFRWIKKYIQRDPTFLATFKSWGVSRPQAEAAIQAIEDYSTGSYNTTPVTTLKATIEAETGAVTVAQAKAIWYAWAAWRGEFKL